MMKILTALLMLLIGPLAAGEDRIVAPALLPPCRATGDASRAGAALETLKSTDPAVRLAAVESVYSVCDDSAIDALIEAIADQDWRVREAVGRALCSFQVPRASNSALNALVSPGETKIADPGDLRARCRTILAINQLRDVRYSRKAIGFLFSFLDLEDEKLRRIAEDTAVQLRFTRNGYHELVGIIRQHSFPDFRRKAARLLGGYPEAAAVLADVAATDRDESVRLSAKKALEGMKR